ncbi:Ribokinase-like [Arabidopsis suecica]|uniref:Ribokinase-like n=1 Tax=Arabidopsis suecica TaxID=45249 RepID=A0A8T1XK72_ARASU|nr:Ribokinase-like [Arabidopsis suecica]KAG7653325.1 Ribokinase-like [Arabidopsis suecica]
MYHHAFSLKFHSFSPHYALSLSNFSTQSPNPLLPNFPPFARVPNVSSSLCLRCRSSAADVSPVRYADGSSSIGSLGETGGIVVAEKPIDVATLGNLCVDIVLSVHELPPPSREERKALMDELSLSPPDKKYWEAGGNCNMAIAAARLGLHCVAIGHVGDEIYGEFLLDVLHEEGIGTVALDEGTNAKDTSSFCETLICWVLVDPLQRHGFCSRADFKEEPAFSWITDLSDEVKMAIRQSKVLFCNGYDFDDFSPSFIMSTIDYASKVGTAIFFDPGPRGKSLSKGTPDERRALAHFLRMSDVLLLTSEEAEALTGIRNPVKAGQEILRNGKGTKWVIVKMGAKGSILVTKSSVSVAPAFKVEVVDTVGCGDSFVAAIALGYIRNMPLVNTLTIANAVGAATAMGCGAGRNVAKRHQVVDLMKASKLNDEEKFFEQLLAENSESPRINLLSKGMIKDGSNKQQIETISMEKVVSELLAELELGRCCVKASS